MIHFSNAFGQTIVSTSPENKKVVLEEFTGIHCRYGVLMDILIAQNIQNNNPDNVFLINIHREAIQILVMENPTSEHLLEMP